MSNQDEVKNARTQIVKPKIFNLPRKALSSYQTDILLCVLNLQPHLNVIILNLNLTYKVTRADCDLLSFSKTKKATILRKIFIKKSTFTPPRNRNIDINHQIYSLNNLNLEKI